jgi:hypothetical protein
MCGDTVAAGATTCAGTETGRIVEEVAGDWVTGRRGASSPESLDDEASTSSSKKSSESSSRSVATNTERPAGGGTAADLETLGAGLRGLAIVGAGTAEAESPASGREPRAGIALVPA